MTRTRDIWRKHGLCWDCGGKVLKPYSRCIECLHRGNIARKKYEDNNRMDIQRKMASRRQDRKDNGLCPMCGAPPMDGFISCQNCSERIFREI